MREIKFRAWDKTNKKMFGVIGYFMDSKVKKRKYILERYGGAEEDDIAINLPFGELELMQYTGLLDKNGKEIFEMDILKVDWGGIQDEYIINNKYDKPFVMEWRGYEYPPFSRYLPMPKNIEIIGNIYTDSQLLK